MPKKTVPVFVSATVYNALTRSKLLRDVQRSFRDATGFSLKLVHADPAVVPPARAGTENPFCAIMATTPACCAACLAVQRELQRRLAHKLAPHQVCCFAGMTDLAVPIVVGGEHLATLVGGQVFQQKPTRRQFDRLVRQLHAWGMRNRAKELERAYFKTPVVSPKKTKAAMRLLSILATQLAEFANRCILIARHSEPLSVTDAKTFIHSRAGEQLSLHRVAEHVHVSERHLCKIFKESTGMTITEFLARVRVENAKKLLCDRRLRITDIAERAGFNSISQFNRVFRRYTRTSPTAYRAECQ